MKKRISIISPCWNGEKHLKPYVDGLLSQTCSDVEYIFVDDGSTDRTGEVINSYKDQFERKGWTFTYIRQPKRGGMAKAMNRGLAVFSGEYLCCIDSDDVIAPTYLEELSEFLEAHMECGIVFPWAEEVEEGTQKHLRYYKRDIPKYAQDSLFDDLVLNRDNGEDGVFFAAFMLRTSAFLQMYPGRKIYEGLSGQNAQLVLPVLYNFKCGYVKRVLYKVIARSGSDSRDASTYRQKFYNWEDIYCHVIGEIPNMPDYEKAYYFAKVKDLWQAKRCDLQGKPSTLSPIERIFSVTNEYNGDVKRKVVTLFGIRIRFKVGHRHSAA